MSHLLEPITLGGSIPLRNRVCMGALTRNRCIDNSKPTEATVRYYAERAQDGVGLIIVEGTMISPHGVEWPHVPMLFDESHVEAWKQVTDAVHRHGGKIFFQPWHAGRIQNDNMPMLKDSGYLVLAPSAIKARGGKYRTLPGLPGHTENFVEIEDHGMILEQYRHSVKLAKEAGFDGVELLAQGGYLLHSYLCSHSNQRKDHYGGSVENRCRFPLEVLDAIINEWGPGAVGIKICPTDDYNDSMVSFRELSETYDYLICQLVSRDLGYINISRRGCDLGRSQDESWTPSPRPKGYELPEGYDPVKHFGPLIKFPGSKTMLMANHEYTVEEANQLVKDGQLDIVTFGRPFIHNPDVISRIRNGIPFAGNDRGGFVNYGPYKCPDENYNDWPHATI
ncbi:hypothetical protein AbraIFM66951_003797 [Aspergillus brasiliensis]|uniref:NADH:flavin oxidoreductase/NADH oxidase N-terminal domain-containing protein n=1 Tax=Aspergillus brasiliensis TaxID=319629 RepID=A0A9W6DNY3_9EURO|nr:hypothetical protein AbraCBS73388_007640 [Aspergillus brasiliensis]GKZ50537.1 hypothetical protein AbraIFM66951_003797 [Aspergillus brasiliensis]